MARRIKSLHHNLGDKNVIYHREHRAKRKGRNNTSHKQTSIDYRRKVIKLKEQELDNELQTQKPNFTQ